VDLFRFSLAYSLLMSNPNINPINFDNPAPAYEFNQTRALSIKKIASSAFKPIN